MKRKLIYGLGIFFLMCLFLKCLVVETFTVSLHQQDALIDVIQNKYEDCVIEVDDCQVQYDTIGKYTVYYTVNGFHYTSVVIVEDIEKPIVVVRDVEIDLGMEVSAQDFIVSIEDDSVVVISFVENYVFDCQGVFDISVLVEDIYGNFTVESATLTILEEDTAVPEFDAMLDLFIEINSSVNYLEGIHCRDNQDPNPQVEVIKSEVNLSVEGTYLVYYCCKDRSGNESFFTREAHVVSNRIIGNFLQSETKTVYLTFDDGPSEYTLAVLDILEKYNIQATFFVIGSNIEYLHLIEEIEKRGHTIGLHSFHHEYDEIYTSVEDYLEDFTQIALYCKDVIGYIPRYIRFPGGSSNEISKLYSQGIMSRLVEKMNALGFQYYDWNVTSGDGSANVPTNSIIEQSIGSTLNNIILLLHDANKKQTTVDALESIIQYYLDEGYEFSGIHDESYVYHHNVSN